MLEFKNTKVNFSDGETTKPFSLVVDDGDIVCLCGSHGSGKTRILRTILGLAPISSGFITYDGELITPGSSSYFRNMIAYIPQNMPKGAMKVSELLHYMLHLHVNSDLKVDTNMLFAYWEKMELEKKLFETSLDSVDNIVLQRIMLSFLPLLNRKVVLIDNIYQSEEIQSFLMHLASSGSEIIYTCNENKMNCNKIVNL